MEDAKRVELSPLVEGGRGDEATWTEAFETRLCRKGGGFLSTGGFDDVESFRLKRLRDGMPLHFAVVHHQHTRLDPAIE